MKKQLDRIRRALFVIAVTACVCLAPTTAHIVGHAGEPTPARFASPWVHANEVATNSGYGVLAHVAFTGPPLPPGIGPIPRVEAERTADAGGPNDTATRAGDELAAAAQNDAGYDRLITTAVPVPVENARITSRFSAGRLHPVLKVRKPHYGVDYAAPTGTPVVAVADGVVTKAGWNSGGGKTVRIAHASSYKSHYAHLSRIEARIEPGSRVKRGQVIGYVGSTGLANGPHLHFAISKNGEYVDPLTARLPRPPAMEEDAPAVRVSGSAFPPSEEKGS